MPVLDHIGVKDALIGQKFLDAFPTGFVSVKGGRLMVVPLLKIGRDPIGEFRASLLTRDQAFLEARLIHDPFGLSSALYRGCWQVGAFAVDFSVNASVLEPELGAALEERGHKRGTKCTSPLKLVHQKGTFWARNIISR